MRTSRMRLKQMLLWLSISLSVSAARTVHNHVSSICSTWGREHFKTFDGDMYQFPGTCEYNLVSDYNEVYHEFSVHMKRSNNDGIPTVAYVAVTINDLTFHLTKNQVTVNYEPVSLPYFKAGVNVEQNAVYIKLQSKVGITLMWNSEDAVMVELDNDYANRTCGLCGDFNGVPVSDEFIHEGRQINPIEFGNRQKVHRPNDECEDPYEGDEESPLPGTTPDECKKFHAICTKMLRSESWSSCTSQIDPEPYIQACVKDMCGCDDTPTDFCLCSTLSEFSRQCSHAGGDPPRWRNADFCAKQCPYNMVYEESGSPCMDTCSRRDTSSMCEDHKMDGCFCSSGLCGNYNMVLSDDMKTPQGIVEGTAATFSNSWKANIMCSDREERLDEPCSFSVDNERYAKHWCALLKSQSSTFTSCHSSVDPDIYYKRCIYSTCSCEKSEACLCGVFSSYARACASKGVALPDWKENVCEKYMKSCPGSQVFSFNHQRCQLTCRSLALKEDNCISNFSPVDGCTCAEGSYVDDKGTCVPVSKCPCFYNNVYVKPGKSVSIKDEHCVCTNGILHCHSLRLGTSACPSPKVFFNCSSTSPGELSLQCARTCSNLDSDDCDFTECESGCRCPKGLLDDGKGSCVIEKECTCQHEGQIYHPGAKIPNRCNTCICKSGKWLCTRNKCPGSCVFYGSGHYSTFDEKTYGFPGHCAYVAVKNNCGNKAALNSFGVITENVPCGTSSAACSKAIRVQMGDKEIKFSKNKFEETDLGYGPEIAYKIRRVGLYLVLESDIGVGVIWDRKTTVRIVLEPQHSGEVCGLCGNYDGDAHNDFMTQNNLVVNNALEFGNSWKVSSGCPDVSEYENPCDASPNRHHWSKLMCSIIYIKDCKKRVDPLPFYENCVKDSCACDSGGDCECFCTAVAAYAQACSDAEVNEKFEYKCQDCICDEATRSVVCNQKDCPERLVTECKEPGYEPVSQADPSNPCCAALVCQCKLSNCPITDLNCPVGYKPDVFVPPGKCCPEHTCEPKRVCVYKESEYQPGTSVPGPECQDCTCTNEVDPKTGLFIVRCVMKECDRDCQPGYAYMETNPDECCGKCVQTHCVVAVDATTTQLLPQGETWSPPHNKCVYYTCIKSNGALITISSNVVCPPFEESECQPGTIQTAANGCCKVCLEKEKGCKKLSMKTHVTHNNCQSAEMVDMAYCEGPCNTYSIYSQAAEGTRYSCSCCKEVRSSNRTVNLLCLNGETVPYSYMHVEECACGQTSCTKPAVHDRRRRSFPLI